MKEFKKPTTDRHRITNNYRLRDLAIILSLLISCCCCIITVNGTVTAWSITTTKHVLRSDSKPTLTESAHVFAARNETRSFQIAIRSDITVSNINVLICALTNQSGAKIETNQMQVFREYQHHITNGSYRNITFRDDWYSDALIPSINPITKEPLQGAQIRAIPFDLPIDQTHAFWVDISIPTNAISGDYTGTVEISGTAIESTIVPITLTIFDFCLPNTPTLITAFGSPVSALSTNPVPPSVQEQFAQLMADNRINASPQMSTLVPTLGPSNTFLINDLKISTLRNFIDKYRVNAVQLPHPYWFFNDPVTNSVLLTNLFKAFDQGIRNLNRSNVVFYVYLKDEPNTLADYQYVQKWGKAIRSLQTVVKVLVTEQPWTATNFPGADSTWGDLYGSVDIWSPLTSLYKQDSASARQRLGETIWTYTTLCQGQATPWWEIDMPLLNYRIQGWLCWKYKITGMLYWGELSYWKEVVDPWIDVPHYSSGDRNYNGDGSLIYPAHPVGYEGFVSSVRLKGIRDAVNDYEYLTILNNNGYGNYATNISQSLVRSFFDWNTNEADYYISASRCGMQINSNSVLNGSFGQLVGSPGHLRIVY
jgi:Domain of unknown function (DUF4091)